MSNFEESTRLWKIYCVVEKSIAEAMGRTNNIVGEFAEQLVQKHYGGTLAIPSEKGYDLLLDDKKRVQIKARKDDSESVQLSDFRSDDYDYLVVVIFSSKTGMVLKAGKFNKDDIEEFKKERKAQKRFTITTSRNFWEKCIEDITDELNKLLRNFPKD